jgi:hypothetical protein
LIEMMIAIVILGLGLVMTATMFPVAWTRARTLTEFTTQRSVSASADSTLGTLLQAAGPSVRVVVRPGENPAQKLLLVAGSLAGDLFYNPVLHTDPDFSLPPNEIHRSVLLPGDTRVHALNIENISMTGGTVVPENPWRLERNDPWRIGQTADICEPNYPLSNYTGLLGKEFCANRNAPPPERYGPSSFYAPQVTVGARVYPPMTPLPPPTASPDVREKWNDKLSARRYAWAVLHRLQTLVGPDVSTLQTNQKAAFAARAADASGTTRVFDMYVVTLRRTQPSNRYAMQDPQFAPDPNDRAVVATPQALKSTEDVVLPAPWRVQIEIPRKLNVRAAIPGGPNASTGVPTEVQFPPTGTTLGNPEQVSQFSQILPSGAQFVDEINGHVYRVTKRREGADGYAFLTLDRELLWEEFDDGLNDPFANPKPPPDLDDDEWIRPVWVFPPAVDRSLADGALPVFDGSSPVVGIDVRTVSLSPPG